MTSGGLGFGVSIPGGGHGRGLGSVHCTSGSPSHRQQAQRNIAFQHLLGQLKTPQQPGQDPQTPGTPGTGNGLTPVAAMGLGRTQQRQLQSHAHEPGGGSTAPSRSAPAPQSQHPFLGSGSGIAMFTTALATTNTTFSGGGGLGFRIQQKHISLATNEQQPRSYLDVWVEAF